LGTAIVAGAGFQEELQLSPIFTNIGNSLGGANFGRATAAEAEREMQLGLKFYF
jgi:hypothetical protein